MKIGLLLPYSKFYPYIGSDLYNCLKFVLGNSHSYVIKDTNLAVPNDNQKALRELILYEHVDMVVGFVGYKSLIAINPLIQQTKTPIIICNAGDHPVLEVDANPYMVHCSLEMFNSIYFACKWAFQNIGHNYSRLLSFFDSGFPIALATELAEKKYSGKVNLTEVSHKNENDDFALHLKQIKKEQNNFVFMGYYGFEAIEAMKYLSQYESFKEIPVVAAPFFAEAETIVANINYPIYSVKTWGNIENSASKTLKKYFKSQLKRDLTFSGILGYEVALIIKHCMAQNWVSKEEIVPKLNNLEIESPRGNLELNTELNNIKAPFYLYEYENSKGNLVPNNIISTIVTDKSDWKTLNSFNEELPGWQNTYLCN
ncbi:MAG: ABC transporter substrate-binding protein [Bacteroidetes bacterium]|nr:ABC transporter substrate-binding protein [Bacteroidota bacterium]